MSLKVSPSFALLIALVITNTLPLCTHAHAEVIDVSNPAAWQRELDRAANDWRPRLLMLKSSRCYPCKEFWPYFYALSNEPQLRDDAVFLVGIDGPDEAYQYFVPYGKQIAPSFFGFAGTEHTANIID